MHRDTSVKQIMNNETPPVIETTAASSTPESPKSGPGHSGKIIAFGMLIGLAALVTSSISIVSTGIGRGERTLVIPRPAGESFFMSDRQTCNELSFMCRANVLAKYRYEAYFQVGFHFPLAVTLAGSKD